MFIHYRSQGFILKKDDRGETDQLLTIYAKDFGKLEILAKAARKISSKLRPAAEIFYLLEIEFIQGKAYKTLTDAVLIEKFENLRKNLKKLKIAYKIAESFSLIKGQEKDEAVWNLLVEALNRLNTKYKIQDVKYKIYYYFFWNLLAILGYEPELYNCVVCRKKLKPDRLFFNFKEGGLICQECEKLLELVKEANEVDLETIKIMRIILEKNWNLLSKLKVGKSNLKTLNEITDKYYSHIRSELTFS